MTGPRDVCQVRNVTHSITAPLDDGRTVIIACQLEPLEPPLDESGKRWILATTGGAIEIEPGLFLELKLTQQR